MTEPNKSPSTSSNRVRFRSSDSVYPGAVGNVVKRDKREGKDYLGVEITGLFAYGQHWSDHGIDHVVWRYADQLEEIA